MKLSRSKLSFYSICRIGIVSVFLFSITDLGYAQKQSDNEVKVLPHIQKKMEQFKERGLLPEQTETTNQTLTPRQSDVDLNSLESDFTVFEHDQSWNRNLNPNPDQNFAFYEQGQPAGDINGDGNDDFIVTGIGRDETTGDLHDQTWKTAVFFGGNTSGIPDQVVYRKLIPAGDLNGDGYADAVALETSLQNSSNDNQLAVIYEGTQNGFVETGNTFYDGFIDGENAHIAFHDFNDDGYDDVLSYFPDGSEDVYIFWGEPSLSAVTFQVYGNILPMGPHRVVIEDVDNDILKEMVSLTGSYGDGQIQVSQIDTTAKAEPSTGISVQQQFAFNLFTGLANEQDLHLVDINGSGNPEIYISEGRRASKHVIEYDVTNEQYFTTSNEFFNGSLVPAGDLNNDGRHDFIQGDSTSSYHPWISYGPANIADGLTLDYELSGNNSTNWQWEMGYNPYNSFGDLNGDGLEDVVLEHREDANGNISFGRRILQGSESEPFNSVFHQIPIENISSEVVATQNIGDINDDGVEDFAMVMPFLKKIEIYYGGEDISQTPDITMGFDYHPYFVETGDFNGDGATDIGINGRNVYFSNGSVIEIFWGSSNLEGAADVTISAANFQDVSFPEIYGIYNVGDINNDGIDDFVTGSSGAHDIIDERATYLNEGYIFYGGTSISTTPDETIDLGDGSGNYLWAGERAASLGDINGDSIDDFAFAVPAGMNPDETLGQVQIFYGSADNTYSAADIILTPSDYSTSYFGWGLASGDYNGDGAPDLAVTGIQFNSNETEPAKAIHIYNGGSNFDNTADRFLTRPQYNLSLYEEAGTYYSLGIYGTLETLPDFTNDGKEELLHTSSQMGASHAGIYTFNAGRDKPSMVLKGPNKDAGLGGPLTTAHGDFNGNGELDLVLTQMYDNNDAQYSSRVYRYGMSNPIAIASIEDVPDDQGEWIRVSVDGYLMDAMSEDIYGFDSWAVRRMEEDSSWTSVATVKPYSDGSKFVDVRVPKTQPTDDNSVDNTYYFKVIAYHYSNNNTIEVLSETSVDSGKAFDNIAPGQVSGVTVDEQTDKTISWSAAADGDIGGYEIYEIDSEGNISDSVVGNSPYTTTSFTLPEYFGGVRNFAVRARDVNNNAGPISKAASAIYPLTTAYHFNAGWNLIGLPVDANPDSVQTHIQDVAQSDIFEYDGGYSEVTEMKAGKGYWIKFSSDELRELQGRPVTDMTINLKEGWNLVSGIGGDFPIVMVEDPDEILLSETIYEFDQMYAASDTLRPGTGYWVRASAEGSVTFVHPKIQATMGETSTRNTQPLAKKNEGIEKSFGKIVLSDGNHERKLYFGSELAEQVDKRNYSLPPLPPGDIFDARFTDDMRLTEDVEATIQLSKIEGTAINITLDTQNLIEHNQFVVKEYGGNELLADYTVTGDESFNLRHRETDSITFAPAGNDAMAGNDIPEEFKLEQNYPNPFNPTTQIEYSVTEQANVTLEVFNILGRKVATLINNEQSPGSYQVTFDGSNLASGVYLYRLQAGDRVSTKKFILAK